MGFHVSCLPTPSVITTWGEGAGVFILQIPSVIGQILFLGDLILWHFWSATWTQWALVAREGPQAESLPLAFGSGAGSKEDMGGAWPVWPSG